jgi:tetratricopeptide (TPR) repeat protein
LYPRISHLPIWQVAGAALLLAGITFGVIRFARRRPYLPVGWFWFLGALVPVIGIVQVGNQAMADRYTYIPLIGLFIMVTWGMTDIWVEQSFARPVLGLLAAVALLASAWLTHTQVAYWQDSIKLFSHMAVVRPEVPLAHNNIGAALYDQERFAEAMLPLREALRLNPHYVDAHNNLGLCFWRSGQDQEAIVQFEAEL